MNLRHILILPSLLLVLTASSCEDKNNPDKAFKGLDKVEFTESDEVFPNPERGFYSSIEIHQAGKASVTKAKVDVARKQGRSLFLIEYYLTDYMDGAIADDYIQTIRDNFLALRETGAKCLLRFAYKNGYDETDRPWDAPVDVVLGHVAQLKPLLQEFSDVIFVMQAGFVGAWGEWYYTQYFNMNPRTEAQYAPRKQLLEALLDALPASRQIEVRTPTFKMKIFGYALDDTLTVAEAHSASVKARIAGHNDCFLKSGDDSGTFASKSEREYWMAETRYTIMGGESCGTSNYCHCEDTTVPGAITTLQDYHFTYLNIGYHPQVLGMWRTEKCFDQVEKRLGYRLVLREGYFTPEPAAGADFRVALKIENVGFAAPMNPRDAELVLSDSTGKAVKTYKVDSDPRSWFENQTVTVDQTLQLPSGLNGEYTLSLNLPDPEGTLRDNPRFSIRLANEGVWDEETGYNKLATISIK